MSENIDDLVKQLGELNQNMRDHLRKVSGDITSTTQTKSDNTAEKVSSSFDKSTTKIVQALGILNSSILGTAKSAKKKDIELDKFNDAVEKSTKVVEESTKEREQFVADAKKAAEKKKKDDEEAEKLRLDALKIQKERDADAKKEAAAKRKAAIDDGLAAAEKRQEDRKFSKDQWDRAKKLSESGDLLHDTFETMGGRVGKFGKGVLKVGEALEPAFKGLAQGVSSYSSALYNGQRGMEVAAKSTNEVINGTAETLGNIISFASWFMPGGLIVKGITAAFGFLLPKVVKTTTEVLEKAAKQSDVLYKSFNQLSQVGGTTAEGLEGVKKTAQSLGYTMAEMEEYNKLILGNSKNIKAFGVTVAEGAQRMGKVTDALYNSETGRSLENLGVTLDEQRESALAYMTIQAKSGQLMKKTDDDLVKGTAEFVKELDAAATLTGTTRKEQQEARLQAQADAQFRAAQRVAERNGDTEKMKKLETYAKMAAMVEKYDPEGAKGIRRYAAGGMAAGEAAQNAAHMYGLSKVKGGESEAELAEQASKSIERNQRRYDRINMYQEKISGVQTDTVGSADLKLSIDPALEMAKKEGISLTEAQKRIQAEKQKGSPALAANIETRRLQQKAAMNLDNSVDVFAGSTHAYQKATKLYAESTKILAEALGAKKPEFGSKASPSASASAAPSPTTTKTSSASSPSTSATTSESKPDTSQGSGSGSKKLKNAHLSVDYGDSVKTGGSKSWRNNNPGNIRGNGDFAKSQGAIGVDKDGFAIFPDEATGNKAREKLLFEGKNYKGLSVSAAISKYAPPNENNTWAYIADVSKAIGVDPNTKMSDLTPEQRQKMLAAMKKKEGYEAGMVTAKEGGTKKQNDLATLSEKNTDVSKVLRFGNESGSKENFDGLDPSIQSKVVAAATEYNKLTGNTLLINSAKRDSEKQKELYDKWIASGRQGNPVAKPGTSLHELGQAVDIEQGKFDKAAIASLNNQGLYQRVKDDPVHFQARTGGIFSGPSTGYNVELHGDEVVVPANEGVSKQALGPNIFGQDDSVMEKIITVFEKMIDKQDTVISLLEGNNSYNRKLLSAMS